MHLCQLTICSHHFWMGATANPPKGDDWRWSTDKGAYVINNFLRNMYFNNMALRIQMRLHKCFDLTVIGEKNPTLQDC